MEAESDQIVLKLEPIFVKGQIGISYRATYPATETDADRGYITVLTLVDNESASNAHVLKVGTYFIKCPDDKLDPDGQKDFVDKEFANGTSINHAATRINASESFNINNLIGSGMLRDPRRGIENRPCLIYNYAGKVDDATNRTLATCRDDPYQGGAGAFLNFAKTFARAVQVLHNQGIVHTFIVPRNIIWAKRDKKTNDRIEQLTGSYTLVGFGYARLVDAVGKTGKPTSIDKEDNWFRAPECRDDRSHAAFGFPADIYSIGAILYSLLLGPKPKIMESASESELKAIITRYEAAIKVIRAPFTDSRRLREEVARHIGVAQPALLRENENILKIIDSCLRFDAEQRYSCVEELIEAIDIAISAGAGRGKPTGQRAESSKAIAEADFVSRVSSWHVSDQSATRSNKTRKATPIYFGELKNTLAEELAQAYGRLERGHLEVYGHRDRIVASLCRLLGSAREKHRYRTMTLPDYWTDENLGSFGRFLTMNKHMARRGVKIDRLFLVSRDFHSLPEKEQVVLEKQLEVVRDLEREQADERMQLNRHKESKLVIPEIKVLVVPEEQIADFERNGELVAYLEYDEGPARQGSQQVICLNFFSTARETMVNGQISVHRTIKKVRYWNPDSISRSAQFKKSRGKFADDWNTSELLDRYIRPIKCAEDRDKVTLETLIGTATEGV